MLKEAFFSIIYYAGQFYNERSIIFTKKSKNGYYIYMNRNLVQKKKPSYKVVVFWSIIALLTLVFVGFVIFKFVETNSKVTIDDITNLRQQQIFEQEGTYYVYVYSKLGVTEEKYELEKAKELEQLITNYLNYAKKNKNANKLFGMIVDSGSGTYGNNSVLIEGDSLNTSTVNVSTFSNLRIHKKDLPILLKIKDGKVTTQYLKETEIRNELQLAMGIE